MPVRHLYIHIPFCSRRCGYCDFFSVAGGDRLMHPYVDALLEELDSFRGQLGPLETVYLGGGTPTLLEEPLLLRLIEAITPPGVEGLELTVEANPETMTDRMAATLARAGVNRVSLGAQSFSPRLRGLLDRTGPPGDVARAVAALRRAGICNISLDLIYGVLDQTRAELVADIDAALELEPEHLSGYELTVKEGSPFFRRHGEGMKAGGEQGREFYETVVDRLEGAGYAWYETSSFARPGRECRHNIAYWRGEDYLGLGAGAWSTVAGRRWQNAPELEVYLAGETVRRGARRQEHLTPDQLLAERLVLGLRMAAGVSAQAVAGAVDEDEAERLRLHGFIAGDGDKLSLTREGRFVANEVCARLLKG